MDNLGKKFSENLFELRRERKFSQQEVALRIHSSQQCVSQWEKGITEPTLTYLWRLADLFEVDVDELIGRKDF
ncbi:MAG: helix-turn-helix transcriptional regulator [Clostridia bacterium]|nr:helix-turn-helix transcriptional regulator [Clostridia bacterium]